MSGAGAQNVTPVSNNVVAFTPRLQRQPLYVRLAQHAQLFATGRRREEDVFWLKENAEFLNILHSTGQPADDALSHYEAVYDDIDARLGRYPQYYRFLVSICLDLEDMGLGRSKGEAMCAWIQNQGLAQAELSDLQRAEAARLLSRRNVGQVDAGLLARLHRFINRAQTFAVPNKKAAYELTHIVFYLSNYGRRDPGLGINALRSLQYAGVLAYLDQNYDLLAEVCVALFYARQKPSAIWLGAVMAALRSAQASPSPDIAVQDEYHTYLVANWMAGCSNLETFPITLEPQAVRFDMAAPPARPLVQMGKALQSVGDLDWDAAKPLIADQLDHDGHSILDAAERSIDGFDAFYDIFKRAARPMNR